MRNMLLSWSGGKDSALALYRLRQNRAEDIVGLLTTVTEDYNRISMHGVRRELLVKQAESLGLHVTEVMIPRESTNAVYEERMRSTLTRLRDDMGIRAVAFGDLFLQDIRAYREERMSELSLDAEFPLWGADTGELAREFISAGFKAVICCVDPRQLDADYCGAEYDLNFLESVPPTVDPCGENGEFHTFVYDGPIFNRKIDHSIGEKVLRGGFHYSDILPL